MTEMTNTPDLTTTSPHAGDGGIIKRSETDREIDTGDSDQGHTAGSVVNGRIRSREMPQEVTIEADHGRRTDHAKRARADMLGREEHMLTCAAHARSTNMRQESWLPRAASTDCAMNHYFRVRLAVLDRTA